MDLAWLRYGKWGITVFVLRCCTCLTDMLLLLHHYGKNMLVEVERAEFGTERIDPNKNLGHLSIR